MSPDCVKLRLEPLSTSAPGDLVDGRRGVDHRPFMEHPLPMQDFACQHRSRVIRQMHDHGRFFSAVEPDLRVRRAIDFPLRRALWLFVIQQTPNRSETLFLGDGFGVHVKSTLIIQSNGLPFRVGVGTKTQKKRRDNETRGDEWTGFHGNKSVETQ